MTDWDVILDVLEEYDKEAVKVTVYAAPDGGDALYMTWATPWVRHRRSKAPALFLSGWMDLGWTTDD